MSREKMVKTLATFTGALALVFIAGVGMCEEMLEPTVLEPVRVVGSPIIEGNAIDAFAAQKTVVTDQQMEDLNAQDLQTALRQTPGVTISRYNPIGSFGGATGGAVFIRGLGSSRPGAEIKTFVDGVPVYMSIWNHPLLDLLPIDPAQSVEVYKSPQPHVFGNAFAAVNLVPKAALKEGYQTTLRGSYGSYDTAVVQGEHGGRPTDRWDYYLAGAYRRSDGHRDNANGELGNAYARLGGTINSHWGAYAFALWNDNYADDPGAKGAPRAQRLGRYETRLWLVTASLTNEYEKASGFFKVYRSSGEGDWLDQPTSREGVREDLFNDFLFYGFKARESFRLWPGSELVAGLDWDRTEGDYVARFTDGKRDVWDGHDFTLLSPYAALSHTFGDPQGFRVIPSVGVRYYDHTDFDGQWSPHVGVIVGYGHTELHASYARGVLYPGLDVVVFSQKVIPALKDTWKDLDAEVLDHFELGIRHRWAEKLTVDVTAFYDEGSDRYVVVPPPPFPPIYDNVEDYTLKGAEATATFFATDRLAFFAGATYLVADPDDLPYTPKWTVTGGLNWRFLDRWTLNVDGERVGSMAVREQARRFGALNTQKVDAYVLLNGKLSYQFPLSHTKAQGTVYVAVENILNEDYEYLPGYPMPGTNVMFGAKFTF
ncbi:TonB-dependent receptor [Desulfosoma caldarium]|uniref:Iron complex outermembrane receptor protein n=1 Tax=Desulfosoma caldarium TaxID=610254 RepID=A0A3N1UXE2_9BACT|nr:TonB-dependent receptor plug domain-containing protein [Desulfosoma caldarium]ROQ93197.1 iron complex outermembrane receptor protein [Desulfosoma caldarium]